MKQAVVVIHGIGEQRPMDTLRGFVEAMGGTITAANRTDRSGAVFDGLVGHDVV